MQLCNEAAKEVWRREKDTKLRNLIEVPGCSCPLQRLLGSFIEMGIHKAPHLTSVLIRIYTISWYMAEGFYYLVLSIDKMRKSIW